MDNKTKILSGSFCGIAGLVGAKWTPLRFGLTGKKMKPCSYYNSLILTATNTLVCVTSK